MFNVLVSVYFYSASALPAMQRDILARGVASVRPSVCPSVTRWYTNEDTIVRFSLPGRTTLLVFGEVKFVRIFGGDHPSGGVKVRYSSINSENWTNNATITRKRRKIPRDLPLITNRKSHMGFRLVPKSMSLNDLKPRNGRVVCIISHNLVAFGPY